MGSSKSIFPEELELKMLSCLLRILLLIVKSNFIPIPSPCIVNTSCVCEPICKLEEVAIKPHGIRFNETIYLEVKFYETISTFYLNFYDSNFYSHKNLN